MSNKLDLIFRALADPTRRSVLRLLVLSTTAVNITTVAERFDSTRQAVTKHIQVLEEAGLVKAERSGREVFYTAKPATLRALKTWLSFYEGFWDDKLGALGAYLDKQATGRKRTKTP